jgi:arginine deiminase
MERRRREMTEQLETAVSFSVESEVGTLRKVIVHRPGLEHTRLTPTNAEELLFDDVIWVKRAKEEHDAFVSVMRDRGVEVFEVGDLLTEVLAILRSGKRSASIRCESSRPAGIPSAPSANSGMTATTCSASNPACASRMTAMSIRTRVCARPASR